MMFGGAVLALWAGGPLAGVGALFGLVMLLAGAFLSRRTLVLIVALSVLAIVARANIAIGWLSSTTESEVLAFDVGLLWVRISMITGTLLWISTRVLTVLISSLERSHASAVNAYQIEYEARVELDRSRHDLEIAEQVELVGRLAGGVAHDVNNALTAILAASDVLSDELVTADQRRSLGELEAASHHAAELVRDLLWIGRKLPPGTDDALLDEAVRACRVRLDRRGRKIALAADRHPEIRVAIAAARLEQILYWLVLRADRAGAVELALTASTDGPFVEIVLAGRNSFDAAARASVPPQATRVQLSTTAAAELVEHAGGSLEMTGTENTVRVQIRIPSATVTGRISGASQDQERTALVVEDDPAILHRLVKLVARRGYRVTSASSLAEAWPLLDAADLLVTDLQLGDGCGDELAFSMFERHPGRPIVVCSGFAAEASSLDRLRGAHLTLLTKPFTRAELEHAIPLSGRTST